MCHVNVMTEIVEGDGRSIKVVCGGNGNVRGSTNGGATGAAKGGAKGAAKGSAGENPNGNGKMLLLAWAWVGGAKF
jgi:hypothetical protein